MSFRVKTIVLLILLSLLPYVISILTLGRAYSDDVEAAVIADMRSQLDITLDRLDQNIRTLQNDMAFVASLDVMNDLLSGDIDRRIVEVLLRKKSDLALNGDFDVIDTTGRIVASTDIARIGNSAAGDYFHRVSVHSTFADDVIGELLVHYDPENLTRYFPVEDHIEYRLLAADAADPTSLAVAPQLQLEGALVERPALKVVLLQDRDFAFTALNKLTRNVRVTLLIGTLIIATIAYLAANYLLRPLLLLSTTAQAITNTHDYGKRVVLERRDEIGQLAGAFNSMVAGMQEMIARLKEESENRLKLAQEKNRAEMLQALSNKLSRYLSPQIYQSIFSGEKEVELGSSRKKLTIFFSDIVGFTSTTDQMESEDLTQLLNHYLREMTDIALRHGATIDKYIGDAIMIFFGDPHSLGVAEDAKRCVEMAIAMQQRVRSLQDEWRKVGFAKRFTIRVGIHTGYCTVGNFGTDNRMDYTIIGSSVNLASRIESSADPGSVFISEDTWLLVRDHFACVPVKPLVPKGLTQPVQLYRVLTGAADEQLESHDLNGFHLQYQPDKLDMEARGLIEKLLSRLKQGQ